MSASRLPRRIVTKDYATDYTTTYENVEVDRSRKLDRVFHIKSQKNLSWEKIGKFYLSKVFCLD